jgi:hypothetical protein
MIGGFSLSHFDALVFEVAGAVSLGLFLLTYVLHRLAQFLMDVIRIVREFAQFLKLL